MPSRSRGRVGRVDTSGPDWEQYKQHWDASANARRFFRGLGNLKTEGGAALPAAA